MDDLKARARRAMPFIGRRIQAWNQGNGAPSTWAGTVQYGMTAVERNTIYSSAWSQLPPDRGRYWFQAAAMVTGRGGIKSTEGLIPHMGASAMKMGASVKKALSNSPFLPSRSADSPTAADLDFIIAGNKFLFPFNLHNFFCLRDKQEIVAFELLRGADLDRGLVAFEQSLVQQYVDSYRWPSEGEKDASLSRISQSFRSTRFANDWVRGILERVFPSSFDFGSLNDRIHLGFAIVESLRRGAW